MNPLKSIFAVVVGFVAVGVLHTVTDMALVRAGVFPPINRPDLFTPMLYGIAIGQRSAWNVLGGVLTALLAPNRPVGHAIVLGAIGTAMNIAGAIIMWRVGAHWYPFTLAVLAMPCCGLGGLLVVRTKGNA